MGFAGYFLIVQDFITAAKQMKVAVGPGRGSGAGSAVAFCTQITNIDPLKYNLLFERFLNPERVSMPDFDIDFDDEGRQKVIDYVVDKYGRNQVAHIITYGTMAAKSSIRDVGRVLKLPLSETDKMAKLIPEIPGTTLKKAFSEVPELRDIFKSVGNLEGRTLRMASTLEGSVRHRGIHAAGVIIAPGDITNYIPVCTAKDVDLLVTQFDGKVIEDAGMLKMDFLGLKTLTIIKDAITNIKERHGVEIDPDEIPLDDEKTYELFQRGDTVGVFQFESEGMQMYLRELKPTDIEDLIAMNALYRPGPMEFIPNFINRKHGREQTVYPHEWLEGILKATHGIMVYQEQIMQSAQIMADYSLGGADILRRAMGKKKKEEMDKQRAIFVDGATKKGVDKQQAEDIFGIMEKFASYGFNRSHSAAYSVVAFQTAYLKANYPAEYMAAVLTHNMNDIKSVNFFLSEVNRMGLTALNPDVNESKSKFTVNNKGEIRFGIAAIKGVGAAAVESLIEERENGGYFTSIFDLTKRVNQRTVNRKCLEGLVLAAQYLTADIRDGMTGVEKAIRFGQQFQAQKGSMQNSLFGNAEDMAVKEPDMPVVDEWSEIEVLRREREVTGIYLSGHPLNDYAMEIKSFCNCTLENADQYKNRELTMGAIVVGENHRTTKGGKPFGLFNIEDLNGSMQIALFGENYLKFKHLFTEGNLIHLKGMYKARYNSEDQFEFRVTDVKMLEHIKSITKQVEFHIPLPAINKAMTKQFEKLKTKFKGNVNVKFTIYDVDKTVDFYSNKMTLNTKKEVFELLDELEHVKYKLNDRVR
ncbi:UNVERIFIED_CONTAM: hypothetical protein GTU68_031593 [Idotea baltica]|nr:hypothetical protein [Idotea baltica]